MRRTLVLVALIAAAAAGPGCRKIYRQLTGEKAPPRASRAPAAAESEPAPAAAPRATVEAAPPPREKMSPAEELAQALRAAANAAQGAPQPPAAARPPAPKPPPAKGNAKPAAAAAAAAPAAPPAAKPADSLSVRRTNIKVSEEHPLVAGDALVAYIIDPEASKGGVLGYMSLSDGASMEVPGSNNIYDHLYDACGKKIVWAERTYVTKPGTNTSSSQDVYSIFDTVTGKATSIDPSVVSPPLRGGAIRCSGTLAAVVADRMGRQKRKPLAVIDTAPETPKIVAQFDLAGADDRLPEQIAIDAGSKRVAAVFDESVAIFDLGDPGAKPRTYDLKDVDGVAEDVEVQLAGDWFMFCKDDGSHYREAMLLNVVSGKKMLLKKTRAVGNILLTPAKFAQFLYDHESGDYPLFVGALPGGAAVDPQPAKPKSDGPGTGVASWAAMTPDGSTIFLSGRRGGRELQVSENGAPFRLAPDVTKDFESVKEVVASASVVAFKIVREHVCRLGYAPLGKGAAEKFPELAKAGPARASSAAAEPVTLGVQRTKLDVPQSLPVAAGDGIIVYGYKNSVLEPLGIKYLKLSDGDATTTLDGLQFKNADQCYNEFFGLCRKKIVAALQRYAYTEDWEDYPPVLVVYDTESGTLSELERKEIAPLPHSRRLHCDMDLAATICNRKDVADRKAVRVIDVVDDKPRVRGFDLEGAGEPTFVAVDGAEVQVAAAYGSKLAIFDVTKPEAKPRVVELRGGTVGKDDFAVHMADGELLCSDGKSLKTVDLKTGSVTSEPLGGGPRSVATTEDGKKVLVAGRKDAATPLEIRSGSGPFQPVADATKGEEGVIDVAAGTGIAAFKIVEDDVCKLGFAPVR